MDKKLERLFEDYQKLPEYSDVKIFNINQVSAFGDYPIHTAAVRGNLDELNLLYKNGANLDQIGEYGYTPLLHAVEQGHIDVVKWLVDKGCNINKANEDGNSPEIIAKLMKRVDILDFLKKQQKGGS